MHLLILGLTLQKNNRTRTKGFTLLELLIAISIFAMLSLAAYQILQGVLRSSEISKRHSDSLARLQRAMLIIEQDFTQIAARRSRSEDQDTDDDSVINAGDLLFGSEDQGIEFTRIGWTNPLNLLPRSELLRVRYRLMDGQLQRLYFIYPDLPSGQIPQVQVLLELPKTVLIPMDYLLTLLVQHQLVLQSIDLMKF